MPGVWVSRGAGGEARAAARSHVHARTVIRAGIAKRARRAGWTTHSKSQQTASKHACRRSLADAEQAANSKPQLRPCSESSFAHKKGSTGLRQARS